MPRLPTLSNRKRRVIRWLSIVAILFAGASCLFWMNVDYTRIRGQVVSSHSAGIYGGAFEFRRHDLQTARPSWYSTGVKPYFRVEPYYFSYMPVLGGSNPSYTYLYIIPFALPLSLLAFVGLIYSFLARPLECQCRCGYSLEGLTTNTCPECGRDVAPPANSNTAPDGSV